MKFEVEVFKGRQAPVKLLIEAPDGEAACRAAIDQGWVVLSLHTAGSIMSLGPRPWADVGVKGADLLVFLEQLQSLLSAGLSVIEALETLRKGGQGAGRLALDGVITSLKQGFPFSTALARQGGYPELLVALLRSAEQTSDLPEALERFREHEEKAAKVRHQLSSVALYPALLTVVGGGVIAFLMLYVMPRFARVFEGISQLPWSAQLMVAWANLLRQHGGLMAVVALAVAALIALAIGSPQWRARLLGVVLHWGPLASIMRTYHLARWYRTIGMLVAGGVALPEALALAEPVLPASLQKGASVAALSMQSGLAPSQAFDGAGMATPVASQLIKAGERSGDVGIMLLRAALFHENEVTRNLEKTMRVLEPLVMTLVGIGVGVIVILMYLPIFELASAIQ